MKKNIMTKRTPRPTANLLNPADRDKVAKAVETILTTPGVPVSLFNAVSTFIEEGVSDDIRELWRAPLVSYLIDRVIAREIQGEEVSQADAN